MSKAVIKNTLDIFLDVRVDEEKTNNISIALDEFDTEILADAIDQALKKERTDEDKSESQ